MGADFPVPRAQLPRVEATPHEREARKLQMEQMLLRAIDQYDHFREVDQGRVDPRAWKLVDSRDSLRLFRERDGSGGYKSSSVTMATTSSFSASDDDTTSQSSNGYWEDIPAEAARAAALSNGKLKSMMMVGEMHGRMENAIYAAVTKTNNELALVETFLQDDVADCAILNMMEGPTPENPLQFLGYKWFVKKSPGGGRLVKHRDVVYLEYCGITTLRSGEEIGYLLIESVDLPGFPEWTNRNCVRAVQSVSILLRQKSDTVVDVFMTGVVEPSGNIVRPLSSLLTSQTMFMITKTMDLAECKRLTKMLVSMRHTREERLYNMKHKPTACGLCHQKRKFYNGVSLVDCSICGQVICTRCQTHKRVYIADGILGRYHRVGCCKTCVLAADPTRPTADRMPIKMSISAQMHRQHSTREYESMGSNSASRPRSSSESSVEDLSEFAGNLSLQPTIEEDVPVQSTPSRGRRGSVDHSAGRTQGPGITLLPSSSLVQTRSTARTHNTASRVPLATNSNALVPASQPDFQQQRNRSGSSGSRAQARYLLPQPADTPAVIRPSPAAPTFTSSAPGGTYDLRRNGLAATPTAPARPVAGGAGSSQQELFARMMELRRVAESTYQTTQQNHIIMQQQTNAQRTPSHAARGRGF